MEADCGSANSRGRRPSPGAETAAHETGQMFGMMHNGSPFRPMFSEEKALVTPSANPRWADQYHRGIEDVDVAWLSRCAP